MEKLLKKIADSQGFQPKDELSAIIERYNCELNEESLDMIFAAQKLDYAEFLKKIDKK